MKAAAAIPLAVAAMILNGCTIPPAQPEPVPRWNPPAVHAAQEPPARGAEEASPENEMPTGPLSLSEAIDLALERNPDLQAAAEHIAEAEAQVGVVTSSFYPQVAARLGYARTDNPAQAFAMILNQRRFSPTLDFNDPGTTQNVRPEIVGAFPLFRGGQDYQRRRASLLGLDLAKLEEEALRNGLTEAVISAYYALIAAPEQVDATRASADAVSSAMQQTRSRVAAGTALKADVLSLEVRLAEAREAQVRADNGVELARAALRSLLALEPEAPVEVAPIEAPPPEMEPATFAEALDRANASRPELAAAKRRVEIGEREVKAEIAGYFPRLDAVGSFGNDSSNLELTSAQNNWAFGVAAEVDVFSGFRTRERVRAAERRLAQTRQAERRTRLEVEHEVRSSFLEYDAARRRLAVAQAAVSAAEEALRLVEVQYSAGAATITRYLEAEAGRSAARSRSIAARYDLRRSAAGLQKAMGTWAQKGADEE